MSSTTDTTIRVKTFPGVNEKSIVIKTVVETTYRGVSEKEARELHVAFLNAAAEMNAPVTNGGAGAESDSDVSAANGGAGAEESEADAPEECEREKLTFRVWNAGDCERMEISLDDVPSKVSSATLYFEGIMLMKTNEDCLFLDEEHKYETLDWMESNGFPAPRRDVFVDIKRAKRPAATPAVLPPDCIFIHDKYVEFGTRKIGKKTVRAIFAGNLWLAFNEVVWTSAGLAFRGRKGTWLVTHPEAISMAVSRLIDTGVCPELKKHKNTWMPVSAP